MTGISRAPKRTIYSAFATGNATGGAYRVIVKAGQYEESAFTRNGKNELIQPVAIAGWGGAVRLSDGSLFSQLVKCRCYLFSACKFSEVSVSNRCADG